MTQKIYAAECAVLKKNKPELYGAKRKSFYAIVGQNEAMREIYATIERIAGYPSNVLIYGESGTGKRVTAQAIHRHDFSRCNSPFVEVSCGALPETLLESELFGHVKGAFTGAIKDRKGRFELAEGGTVLLDEIDTCSPAMQVKLLRILEEGIYERVGDGLPQKANVRVIAATNQDLSELVRKKIFREDLYWRLNVITLCLPPLRERKDDISLLCGHFLEHYNRTLRLTARRCAIEHISDAAMRLMLDYDWPGNVRQLQHTIERACIFVKDSRLEERDLPPEIRCCRQPQVFFPADNTSLKDALKEPLRDIIVKALEKAEGNFTKAAVLLNINRATLYQKMRRLGLMRKSIVAGQDN